MIRTVVRLGLVVYGAFYDLDELIDRGGAPR